MIITDRIITESNNTTDVALRNKAYQALITQLELNRSHIPRNIDYDYPLIEECDFRLGVTNNGHDIETKVKILIPLPTSPTIVVVYQYYLNDDFILYCGSYHEA
jgi:hypothetical protein